MSTITLNGIANKGVPAPTMVLTIFVDGIVLSQEVFPGVILGTTKTITSTYNVVGDHIAKGTMDLSNELGTKTYSTIDTPFNVSTGFGRIMGNVFNSRDNSGENNVLITVGGLSDVTENGGAFIVNNVPVGLQTLTLSKTGFISVTTTIDVPEGDKYINALFIEPSTPIPDTLIASLNVSPNSGNAPLTVNVSGNVSGGVPPYTYTLNLGDGNVYHTNNMSWIYGSGNYTLFFAVRDSEGVSDSVSAIVNVDTPIQDPSTVEVFRWCYTVGAATGTSYFTSPDGGFHAVNEGECYIEYADGHAIVTSDPNYSPPQPSDTGGYFPLPSYYPPGCYYFDPAQGTWATLPPLKTPEDMGYAPGGVTECI